MTLALTMMAATIALYATGAVLALAALNGRSARLETVGTWTMVAGLVAHTVWIGTICARTGHPPLTNLPEIATFLSWTVLVLALLLRLRFRVDAAAFFVYPAVLLLVIVSALIAGRYDPLEEAVRSKLFVTHLLLTTLGMAGLLLGAVFTWLYHLHQHSLRTKRRNRLYDWIPSLKMCDDLSFRGLAVGFSLYTGGILAGALWAYRTVGEPMSLRGKELGAIAAWLLFAVLLRSYTSGSFRLRRNLVISVAAVACLAVALTGIRHS